jgi:hypothetical protein
VNRLTTHHRSVNRIQGKFIPVPEDLHRDLQNLVLQAVWGILFMKRDRATGVCTISNRQLASILGKDERTVQRYTEALHRSPWLRKHTKRIPGAKRNELNTYTFPHLEKSSGDKNVVEKNPDLNTSTTATREVSREEIKPSYARMRWEHHRALNHPPAMRRLYEENGALQAENRILRSRHKWRSLEASSRASLGTYTGPTADVDETTFERVRREMEERDRQRKAQQEREEAERKLRDQERAKEYREEQRRMLDHRSRRHHEGSDSEPSSGGRQGSGGAA